MNRKWSATKKQSLRVVGTFAYYFWMAAMTPIKRKSGNQHLHRKTADYLDAVVRKLAAYHRHIQLGFLAQGLLQILSAKFSDLVTAIALRNTLPEFPFLRMTKSTKIYEILD